MGSPLTKNRRVVFRWLPYLEALGVQVAGSKLPTTVKCPLCSRGAATVYDDPGYLPWVHCPHCQFANDLLELGARQQKRPWSELFSQAWADGWIVTDTNNRRQPLASHNWYAKIARRLKQTREDRAVPAARVSAGFGGDDLDWIGVVPKGPWAAPLRKAAHREPAIVVGLERLPGQFTGLWVRTHEAATTFYLQNRSLAFQLGAVIAAHPTFLVTPDMSAALRLHIRHEREVRTVAPVVGLLSARRPNPSWRFLAGRPVFWCTHENVATIREAISCNARLTFETLPDQALSLRGVLRGIIDRAKPWPEALRDRLAELSPALCSSLVRELALSADDATALAAKLPPSMQALVPAPALQFRGQALSTSDAGTQLGDSLISDAVVRILSTKERRGVDYYHVEIEFRGQKFTARPLAATMEQAPERWLRQVCLRRGLGAPFVVRTWRSHLVAIAATLGAAVRGPTTPRGGWDARTQVLVVGDIGLAPSGAIRQFDKPTWRKRLADLPLPIPVGANAIRQLSTPASSLLFSVVAYTAACVISRRFGQLPAPLHITGLADASGLGRTLGIHRVAARQRDDIARVVRRFKAHSWPCHVSLRNVVDVEPACDSGTILTTPRMRFSQARVANRGEHLLALTPETQGNLQHAPTVLMAYLHDLVKRRFVLEPGGSLVLRVQADLAAWWQGLGADYPPNQILGSIEATGRALGALLVTPYGSPGRGWNPLCVERGRRALVESSVYTRQILETDRDLIYIRQRDLATCGVLGEDLQVARVLARLQAGSVTVRFLEEDIVGIDKRVCM